MKAQLPGLRWGQRWKTTPAPELLVGGGLHPDSTAAPILPPSHPVILFPYKWWSSEKSLLKSLHSNLCLRACVWGFQLSTVNTKNGSRQPHYRRSQEPVREHHCQCRWSTVCTWNKLTMQLLKRSQVVNWDGTPVCGRNAAGQRFRTYRRNGNVKDNRMGWLLLGTAGTWKKGNEVLRMMNHQLKAKHENHRASLGDEEVKLRIRIKSRT